MVEIATFVSHDLPQILSLWSECFPDDPVTEETMVKTVFCNDNFAASNLLVAKEGNTVCGFLIGMKRRYPYLDRGLEEDKAWILAMAVSPRFRKKEIGTRLLHTMESHWQTMGVKRIILASFSPYYFFPGIDEKNKAAISFFEFHGYHCLAPAFFMERYLTDFYIPESIEALKTAKEANGYCFRSFQWTDAPEILEFIHHFFSPGWYHHLQQAMMNGQAESLICLCFFQNTLVGYIQRAMDGNPARLGPFGVSTAHRNGGVGTVLLYEMWASMYRQGLNHIFFQSTDEPGRRFYERHAMTVKRTFYHNEKEY